MKRALITGITGQDGSHLAELLLAKGYRVFGMVRGEQTGDRRQETGDRRQKTEDRRQRSATLSHAPDLLTPASCPLTPASCPLTPELYEGNLRDQASIVRVLEKAQPDEIYNLASLSFVPASWQEPVLTGECTAVGVTRLLDAMRQICPKARFYQASSSEMFGNPKATPQNEDTPFHPRSPYGVAKVYGHQITVNYRESCGLFAASGILFNHEGPRRGLEFVTRKITHTVARIKLGLASELRLGNLQAKRDWGYAGDYVRAMWLMLQQDHADDFVIGSGRAHSVMEFVEIAFDRAGLDWRRHVVVDERFYRPADAVLLKADNSKAHRVLGWQPEISFRELVHMMVDADLELVRGQCRRAPCSIVAKSLAIAR